MQELNSKSSQSDVAYRPRASRVARIRQSTPKQPAKSLEFARNSTHKPEKIKQTIHSLRPRVIHVQKKAQPRLGASTRARVSLSKVSDTNKSRQQAHVQPQQEGNSSNTQAQVAPVAQPIKADVNDVNTGRAANTEHRSVTYKRSRIFSLQALKVVQNYKTSNVSVLLNKVSKFVQAQTWLEKDIHGLPAKFVVLPATFIVIALITGVFMQFSVQNNGEDGESSAVAGEVVSTNQRVFGPISADRATYDFKQGSGVFRFKEYIDEIGILVTQQRIPSEIANGTTSVASIVAQQDAGQGTREFNTIHGPAYLAVTTRGELRISFIAHDLLIGISVENSQDLAIATEYINSLQLSMRMPDGAL